MNHSKSNRLTNYALFVDFDEDDDDSIGEEIDIPEPIDEEEEGTDADYDQMEEEVGAGDAGQEFAEDERDDNNMSSDSEALVVMSPAMNRPTSVMPVRVSLYLWINRPYAHDVISVGRPHLEFKKRLSIGQYCALRVHIRAS